MKILKPGLLPEPPPSRIFRGTCSKCGCEVECEETEVSRGERHFGGTTSYWVTCPFTLLSYKCDNQITVKDVNLSKPWRPSHHE